MLWGGWLLPTAPGLPNPLHVQEQGGGIIESGEYFTQGKMYKEHFRAKELQEQHCLVLLTTFLIYLQQFGETFKCSE